MSQPLMLRLDAAALATLFPEGTQARVDLQNAAVAEFIRKNFRDAALGSDVRTKLEGARADAIAEVARARRLIMEQAATDAGLKSHGYGSYKVIGEAETVVKDAARAAVRATATEAAEAAAERVRKDVEAIVDNRINAMINNAAKEAVRKHVDTAVAGLTATAAALKA